MKSLTFEKFSALELNKEEMNVLKGGPRTVGSGQSNGGNDGSTDDKPKKDKKTK